MISVWKQTTRMVLCDNWITSMCVSGLTQCTVSSERCPTELSSCSGVQTFDWCSEDVKNKLTKTIQFDALYSFPGDVKFSNTTVEPDLTQQLIWFIHGNRNKQTHSSISVDIDIDLIINDLLMLTYTEITTELICRVLYQIRPHVILLCMLKLYNLNIS